ncbi:class I SAM-dependent methyltransferase [Halospina sp. K52047b]|uniref:class I SAM-dependent methyltransferase n=1 Tax=Halospina sp. K52047b TaxID=2614160 RepID=UPI00124A7434|nr:class I SAM-dependent methyltransferase [Halospina sp. K52047b]KAA8978528.1 SAM-dependent methyltransferase [Halospina sp. K52047b]
MVAELQVAAAGPEWLPVAAEVAQRLGLECLPEPVDRPAELASPALLVLVSGEGISLQATGKKAPGPVRVDWVHGRSGHRRRQGGAELLVKAIGVGRASRPLRILDATAGLGEDALVLAGFDCELVLFERSPVIAELLADGMARAAHEPALSDRLARMHLERGDATHWLAAHPEAVDVVYLDPMFPEKRNSAAVRKEMQLARSVVGDDGDAALLLETGLAAARHRVVVKRPRRADPLPGPEPATSVEGRSSRFDVYSRRALP